MTDSDIQEANTAIQRDLPPHLSKLPALPVFGKLELSVNPILKPVSKPIYTEEVPDELHEASYSTDEIPGLFALRHCNQMAAKGRIIEALGLGYLYLQRPKLRSSADLSRSVVRKLRVADLLKKLDRLFSEFRIIHDMNEIIAASPNPDSLAEVARGLSALREEVRESLVDDGLAIPKTPLWGKENNTEEWWCINDFEILAASYRHEVEVFLKIAAPYLPKAAKGEPESVSEPRTPERNIASESRGEPKPPQKSRLQRFGEFKLPETVPISGITAGG